MEVDDHGDANIAPMAPAPLNTSKNKKKKANTNATGAGSDSTEGQVMREADDTRVQVANG